MNLRPQQLRVTMLISVGGSSILSSVAIKMGEDERLISCDIPSDLFLVGGLPSGVCVCISDKALC